MPLSRSGADPLVPDGPRSPTPRSGLAWRFRSSAGRGRPAWTRGAAPLCGLIFFCCLRAAAQPPPSTSPKDVENFIRETADDLTNKDTRGFLDRFDPKMPGYETLHYEIEGLVARPGVSCSIEIVAGTDHGDNQQRALELDWILYVETDRPRRQVVKIRIEKQGKKWKITALDPVEFFKPAAVP
jgi:hypothetical protein